MCLQQLNPDLWEFFADNNSFKQLILHLEHAVKSPGFVKYQELVLSGDFYEQFIQMVASKNGRLLTRKQAKQMVYTVFFGDPHLIWANTGVLQLFNEHFPEVAAMLNILKSRGHNDLAILLQRIESFMIVQSITKAFHEKFPDACLFTIHDSILTTPEFVEDLEAEMNSHFTRVIGAPPKLTKVELRPEEAFEEIKKEVSKLNEVQHQGTWVPVIGYEKLYELNPDGDVKSLHARHSGKLLKPRVDRAGYMTVRLSKGGKESTCTIHKLLALHFIPNPNGYEEVNHINGCKLDNNLENLEWITHQGNTQHAYQIGLSRSVNKRKVKDVCTGRIYASQREAASVYKIPYGTCKNYLSGRRKNPTCLRFLD